MPLTHRLRNACALLLMLGCCLCALTARAQQNDNSAKVHAKNIARMSSSDAPGGSKVTITSDGVLNDYSAYRSGDRFYVVIPQANAGHIGSVRGRGYEGAQVQRRGQDVVLSFKLQPGASARVDQRFNQLVVQFNAPDVAAQQQSKNANQATPDTRTLSRTPVELAGTPTPTPAGAHPTPQVKETPAQTASAGTPNTGPTPSVSATPNAQMSPTPAPSPSVAPTLAPEQVAQLQPPPAVPVGAPNPSAPAAAAPVSLGTTLLRNWPWLILALVALAVIGLFVFARGGERREELPPAATAGAPALKEQGATTEAGLDESVEAVWAPKARRRTDEARREDKAIEATRTAPAPEASTSAADAPSAPAPVESATAAPAASDEIAPVLGAAELAVGAGLLAADREAAPAAAESETDQVTTETRKLLAGADYDESIIDAPDAATRRLVAAELLTALATESESAEGARARAAFVKHNYFADVARDLRSAEAPKQRASAARTLGLVGERAATPHLVAALEDPAPEVRRASVEALTELQDPAAVHALEALRWRETSRQLPRKIIQRAIEACSAATLAPPTDLQAAAPAVAETDAPTATEALPPVVAEPTATPATEPVATSALESATADEVEHVAEPAAEAFAPAPEVEPIERAPVAAVEPAPAVEIETPVAEATLEPAKPALESAPAVATAFTEPAPANQSGTVVEPVPASEAELTHAPATPEPAIAEPGAEAVVEEPAVVAEEPTFMPPAVAAEPDAAELIASDAEVAAHEPAPALGIELYAPVETEATAPAVAETHVESAPAELEPELRAGSAREPVRAAAGSEPPPAAAEADYFTAPAEAPATTQQEEKAITGFIDESTGDVNDWFDVDVVAQSPNVEPPGAPPAAEAHVSYDLERDEPTLAEIVAPPAEETREIELASLEAVEVPTEAATPQPPLAAEVLAPAQPSAAEKQMDLAAGESRPRAEKAVQVRFESEDAGERAASVLSLAHLSHTEAFRQIAAAFDDPAAEVREAAARALYTLTEDRADSFTRALREAPPDRRRRIGQAISSSGLADEAIANLTGESRDKTYDAFSLLFLMAKAGETAPLIRAIETHPNNEVRLAVVKLLALSGQQEILPSFRRLAVRGSLPTEVRSAVMEAIYQISSQPQHT